MARAEILYEIRDEKTESARASQPTVSHDVCKT